MALSRASGGQITAPAWQHLAHRQATVSLHAASTFQPIQAGPGSSISRVCSRPAEVGRANIRQSAQPRRQLPRFRPRSRQAGTYHFRIGTAGIPNLVLHTVYLPLALAKEPSTVTIEGGTHVSHSPCYHLLDRRGDPHGAARRVHRLHVERPGFYPPAAGASRPTSTPRPCCAASIQRPQRVRPTQKSSARSLACRSRSLTAKRAVPFTGFRSVDCGVRIALARRLQERTRHRNGDRSRGDVFLRTRRTRQAD